MGHLLFPIVILVIAITRAIASARRASGGMPPPASPMRPSPRPKESDAERQRRFMEAVGLPVDAPVPPPVRPRTSANPPPLQPIQPAGARVAGFPSGRLRRVPTSTPSPTGTPRTQPAAKRAPAPAPAPAPLHASPPPATVAAITPPAPAWKSPAPVAAPVSAVRETYAASGLLLRLRDPAAIRQAIILREVLGPPKALQATAYI